MFCDMLCIILLLGGHNTIQRLVIAGIETSVKSSAQVNTVHRIGSIGRTGVIHTVQIIA